MPMGYLVDNWTLDLGVRGSWQIVFNSYPLLDRIPQNMFMKLTELSQENLATLIWPLVFFDFLFSVEDKIFGLSDT